MIETNAYEEEYYKDIEERMNRQKENQDIIEGYFNNEED